MVFQSYALYPHMNVYDNIAFGLKIRKMPDAEIRKRVKDAADLLGLEKFLDRKPKALSGGQRQRVALGRAIVRNPSVFLFDEPLSNLDAELRVQMRAEISKLQRRLNTTTVYVTHDQVEAMTMGQRIAVLSACDKNEAARHQPDAMRFADGSVRPARQYLRGALHRHAQYEHRAGAAERRRRYCEFAGRQHAGQRAIQSRLHGR